MRIGIDVTWLKPKKSGGVESYLRNLLDGFISIENNNEYILLTAKDNDSTFDCYLKDKRFSKIICNTYANKVKSHLLWQNLCEYKVLKKNKIDFCFFPVYEMPVYKNKKIKCVTTICDIQALHYPEYFSKLENVWFKIGWQKALNNADMIIAISDFTKEDLTKNFKHKDNIKRIYLPIVINDDKVNFDVLAKRYNIEKNKYFYTVSSLHKHKNLITLINTIEIIVKEKFKGIPDKLVISGIGGPQKVELENIIKEKKLEKNIILTPFIANEERNCLIKNNNVFLFPSIFEGFGMPPIEALMLGSKVITTKCTSLMEVTKGYCTYVEDPLNENEWIEQIKKVQLLPNKKYKFPEYAKETIAQEYLETFYEIYKNERE
ncbi:MAG: glycosyltransferase family 4 protein [Bacilli bacterium]